jgi:hypothetical protein
MVTTTCLVTPYTDATACGTSTNKIQQMEEEMGSLHEEVALQNEDCDLDDPARDEAPRHHHQ